MRSLHLADALLYGNDVSFASHILLAQQGIRLSRQAPRSYLNGGSRFSQAALPAQAIPTILGITQDSA